MILPFLENNLFTEVTVDLSYTIRLWCLFELRSFLMKRDPLTGSNAWVPSKTDGLAPGLSFCYCPDRNQWFLLWKTMCHQWSWLLFHKIIPLMPYTCDILKYISLLLQFRKTWKYSWMWTGHIRSSVQFSCSVMSDSLQPHERQRARPPCPSPTPRVHSNPCPLSRWCHPTTHPLSSPSPTTLNLSQHQGLFKWVSSSHQVAKVLELQGLR